MVDKPMNKNFKPAAAKLPVSKPLAMPAVAAPKSIIENPAPLPVVAPAPVTTKTAPVALAAVVAAPEPVAVPVIPEGTNTMNETINNAQQTAHNFANTATERATEMFGDVSARAKTAMEKGSKTMEDMVEFSKGNIEAVVASGRVAAKGAQDIAKYSAEYGRKSIEDATSTAKRFAAVKSPTEFFALQSEIAKSQLDAMVGEASKFSESYLKLLGEIVQPIQNRYAVAVEKVKTSVAA